MTSISSLTLRLSEKHLFPDTIGPEKAVLLTGGNSHRILLILKESQAVVTARGWGSRLALVLRVLGGEQGYMGRASSCGASPQPP